MEFKKGQLLISEPFLNDPNFLRSVVLLVEHGSSGTIGFVMNQKSELSMEDVSEDFVNIDFPVYVGGPVDHRSIHFVHTLGDRIANTTPIGGDLYWGGDFDQVLELTRLGLIKAHEIRYFIGYSGWGGGQLAEECRAKTWIVLEMPQTPLLSIDTQDMWREILKSKGGKFKEISNYPVDPRMN